ncbi:hypothetical protein [Natronoarchaeum rubrum]|uniref:hypothetical protein n=1 Tax=Natronoarchaeum rubrum TaxID=755311 RepID=UPI0021114399|nr:hypothetical protein [Natronoarchaeum rubrum]
MPEPRQQRLGAYLARTDSDGADVLDDLDAPRRQAFLDADSGLQDSLTIAHRRSDSFDANRFLRATDTDSRQVLQRVDDATATRLLVRYGEGDLDPDHLRQLNTLLTNSEMDQADIQRMMGMLETKKDDPLLDEEIDAGDLINLAASDKSDLDQTRIVGKTDDGEPLWFESGRYRPGADDNHG